jgi:LmbE family N-acetylglucosaminyl deacetylase/peptidoglycan/LPS O-acetylase OafA/YrhL
MVSKRLEWLDAFRGMALLYMVICHLFNYFSVNSIYGSMPYYIKELNSPTLFPPPYLFLFVSGMSVFLLRKKFLSLGLEPSQIIGGVIKRYGFYVLLSLPFTAIMFGFNTYFRWEEAIQGIGMAAIFTMIILLFLKPKLRYYLPIIVIFYLLLSFLIGLNKDTGALSEFPVDFDLENYGVFQLFTGTLLNLLFRGWFSLLTLIPIMLAGIIFLKNFLDNEYRRNVVISILFLSTAILLHLSGLKIDYNHRSFSLIFLIIGECGLVCSGMYYLSEIKKMSFFSEPLSIYGRFSLGIYVGHFLFIVKAFQLMGWADTFSDEISWLLAIFFATLIYIIGEIYMNGLKSWIPRRALNLAVISFIILSFIFASGSAFMSPEKRILVFTAHQDDESCGLAGILMKNAREGNGIKIVLFTDGSPEEYGKDRGWTEIRNGELLSALSLTGLGEDSLVFLNHDDLGFIFDLGVNGTVELIENVTSLINEERPDEVYVHAYEHGHLDHDSVNFIVAKAFQRSDVGDKAEIYEFLEYNALYWDKPIPDDMDVINNERYPLIALEMTDGEKKLKMDMISKYVSQDVNGICDLEKDSGSISKECYDSVVGHYYKGPDLIRELPPYDYEKSPCLNNSCRYSFSIGEQRWANFYNLTIEVESMLSA